MNARTLNAKEIEKLTTLTMQSVRNLVHNGVMYAVFITKRYTKIGWMAEIDGKFYSQVARLALTTQKDDIIDYYLAIDKNAKDSIDTLCKER